jgi:hypothetical protein
MKIDLKNAVINFKSGGTGSNVKTLEVKIGEGNITWTEKRNMEYTLDRGQLDTVREGDEVPVDVKIDLVYEFLTVGLHQLGSVLPAILANPSPLTLKWSIRLLAAAKTRKPF